MAMTRRTQGVIAGVGLAVAALLAFVLWRGSKTPVPAPVVGNESVASQSVASQSGASAASPMAAPSSAAPAAAPPASPAPSASPSSKDAIAGAERWLRLNADTETYRLMALRVLRENHIAARLSEFYCIDGVCRGTLVEGAPEEYARWADLMSRDTSTRFDSFEWSLQTVDGNRRMSFSIYHSAPKAAP